jgi:hypothetical protein
MTSAIDCGCYRSTFDIILSHMVRSLASHNRHGFNLKRGLLNRGGGGEGHWQCGGALVAARV